MGRLSEWKSIVFIALFNFFHKILKFFGWDFCPLTTENVLNGLNSAEKEEAIREDFMVPLKITLRCLNSYEHLTGFQQFVNLGKLRYVNIFSTFLIAKWNIFFTAYQFHSFNDLVKRII